MTNHPRHFAVRQRGAASVIVSVLFLVIVGYGAVIMLDMGAGEMHDANLGDADMQAQLLAEAGLERAFYRFKNGTVCTSVACSPSGCPALDGPYTLGSGQFTVNVAALEGSDCRITVLGQVGTSKATVQGLAKPTWNLQERFSVSGSVSNWPVTYTFTQGSSGYDSGQNCPLPPCISSQGGSLHMGTFGGTGDQRLAGYREYTLTAVTVTKPLTTTSGMILNYDIGYHKTLSNTSRPAIQHKLEVWLYESSSGLYDKVWSNIATGNIPWTNASNPVGQVALTAGRTYDRVRIVFELQENGRSRVRQWIDEINLSL